MHLDLILECSQSFLFLVFILDQAAFRGWHLEGVTLEDTKSAGGEQVSGIGRCHASEELDSLVHHGSFVVSLQCLQRSHQQPPLHAVKLCTTNTVHAEIHQSSRLHLLSTAGASTALNTH